MTIGPLLGLAAVALVLTTFGLGALRRAECPGRLSRSRAGGRGSLLLDAGRAAYFRLGRRPPPRRDIRPDQRRDLPPWSGSHAVHHHGDHERKQRDQRNRRRRRDRGRVGSVPVLDPGVRTGPPPRPAGPGRACVRCTLSMCHRAWRRPARTYPSIVSSDRVDAAYREAVSRSGTRSTPNRSGACSSWAMRRTAAGARVGAFGDVGDRHPRACRLRPHHDGSVSHYCLSHARCPIVAVPSTGSSDRRATRARSRRDVST